MREFITGADAMARAAIDAGCDFFAGYPITPATPIMLSLLREFPRLGKVAIQTEDEIAAIGMCIGAAMCGARVFTATSGPGISLYSENIGLAIMGEVPLVIVNSQRMGPATGAATTTAQGDIQFLRWGTSGGYPLIVLAPTGIVDSYTLTVRAFDLAERFRAPVILATDKETMLARGTVDSSDLAAPAVRPRKTAPPDKPYLPYAVENPGDVPVFAAFGGPHLVRFTTSSHDPAGQITKNPSTLDALNRHLEAKISQHVDEIALLETDLEPEAETLIISYGITARAARQAVLTARQRGVRVSLVVVYSLWPIPERQLRELIGPAQRIIVPELNLGQYAREIERLAGPRPVVGVQRVDGELISPEQILSEGGLL